MSFTSDNTTKNAFPMLNMMMNAQRIGLRAMSVYQPFVSALLDPPNTAQRAPQSASGAYNRSSESRDLHDANVEQVIGMGEEILNVETRMVPGKTTRVRRVVVEAPVQQDVTLHTETVIVERRKPVANSGNDLLTEVTVEMSDFNEVPVVSKAVHLVEEVLLRKEVTARVETIHDTVRQDKLEIEQQSNLPVVFNPSRKHDSKKQRLS